MAETFTWAPDNGASLTRQPRILAAQFGDGYEQRAANGINATLRTFNLNFSGRSLTDSQAIEAFLLARAGVEAFKYTHPGDTIGYFVCKSWTRSDAACNVQNLSATFTEVPYIYEA